jgi:hypothetical protein
MPTLGGNMRQPLPRDRHGYGPRRQRRLLKRQVPVYSVEGERKLRRRIKGQTDGIGSRPRLRGSGANGDPLAERAYPIEAVPDVPAAMEIAAAGCGTSFASTRSPWGTVSSTAVRITTDRCYARPDRSPALFQ